MCRHLTVATSLVAEHRLQVLKLQQVRLAGPGHRLQLPRARRLFLDQGSNPCPLRSQADSCLCLFIFCFQLRAAEVEIKDLQSEFELEKIDYLATIRRQERDFLLFQQLLEQVQPLIRRDCNYSNPESQS